MLWPYSLGALSKKTISTVRGGPNSVPPPLQPLGTAHTVRDVRWGVSGDGGLNLGLLIPVSRTAVRLISWCRISKRKVVCIRLFML